MDRSILHCDMNNFYASVERLFDPELAGVPVAVCGEKELRHGIVLAKSEEAKKCGVKTGDPIWKALNDCPELRIVPPHFDRYMTYSRLAKEIYLEYTDLVESFGPDECWLDVTASRMAFGDGVGIAKEIRNRCRKELGLTVSVGISFNKVFAKLGSDLKKPDAQTYLPREDMAEKIWPLPVESMLGIGKSSADVLHRFGIDTLGKLAHTDDYLLHLKFGKRGKEMKRFARGEDDSPVLPADAHIPAKSVGRGLTTPKDLETEEEVWTLILALARDVGQKLRAIGMQARGVAIECRTKSLLTSSLQKKLPCPTNTSAVLAKAAFSLFRQRYLFHEPLRSLTVRATDLAEESTQLSLFTRSEEEREAALDRIGDHLSARFGKNVLTPARLLRQDLPDTADYLPFH